VVLLWEESYAEVLWADGVEPGVVVDVEVCEDPGEDASEVNC
jgi:hypothetical protein